MLKWYIKYALLFIASTSHNFGFVRATETITKPRDARRAGNRGQLTNEKQKFINEFQEVGKKWMDIAKTMDDGLVGDFEGFVKKKIKDLKDILTDDENESVSYSSDESNKRNFESHKGKKKKSRSTSSSSGEKGSSDARKSSLQVSDDSVSSSSDQITKKNKKKPVSSAERTGWRKYHRKCQKCPEDMKKKWRDPSIHWICGAYQRARRSFKSTCMMYYRNCQDGTMFVKIHDHKCKNGSASDDLPHGEHFFYDYKAALSEDSSNTDDDESSLPSDSDT